MTAAVPNRVSLARRGYGTAHKGRRRRARRAATHETYRGREKREEKSE